MQALVHRARSAHRTKRMGSSTIRELLKLTEQPDIISFAGGLPAPDVFPVEEFAAACDRVLLLHGAQALQYGTTEGYLPFAEQIARHTNRYGIQVGPDNVHHLRVAASVGSARPYLCQPGRSHPGSNRPPIWERYRPGMPTAAEYVAVPINKQGMNTDYLENALRSGPKFIYVLPNFQNPSGVTLSLERRKILVELADRYGVPIIEDDPYGQLRFEGDHLPSVVSLDDRYRNNGGNVYHGNVIYCSTFSKILAPGLRLAWIVAPTEVIRKLVQAKQGADLHTATFNQLVAHEISRGGFLDEHIKFIRKVYRERRDVMLAAMDRYFPPEVDWTQPAGGLFLWGTLPQELSADVLLKDAVEQKVAFVPGGSFPPARRRRKHDAPEFLQCNTGDDHRRHPPPGRPFARKDQEPGEALS